MMAALFAQHLHMAWGSGDPNWETTQPINATFDQHDTIVLPYAIGLGSVVLKSHDGATTYALNVDYTLNLNAGTISRIGGGAINAGATMSGSYYAKTPTEPSGATGLVNELGRRVVDSAQFLVVDANGVIVDPSGAHFSVTATQTNMGLFTATFDYGDAPTATIREIAIFTASVPVAGLPDGQRYFTPDQLQSTGTLLSLQNFSTAQPRVAYKREQYMHRLIL